MLNTEKSFSNQITTQLDSHRLVPSKSFVRKQTAGQSPLRAGSRDIDSKTGQLYISSARTKHTQDDAIIFSDNQNNQINISMEDDANKMNDILELEMDHMALSK